MGEGGCRVPCFFPHEDVLTFPVPVLNVANLCFFSSTVNKQITPENCEEKKPPVHINELNSSVLCPCVYTQSPQGRNALDYCIAVSKSRQNITRRPCCFPLYIPIKDPRGTCPRREDSER